MKKRRTDARRGTGFGTEKYSLFFQARLKSKAASYSGTEKGEKTKHRISCPASTFPNSAEPMKFPHREKDSSTADADEKTEAGALENGTVDGALVIRSVRAGYGRHEQDSNRIGQRAGKQDAGHRHAGVYAISRKRLMGGIAKQLQADQDAGGFDCSEQMQADSRVAHRGAAKENSLENSSGRESFSGRLSGEFFWKNGFLRQNGNHHGSAFPDDKSDCSELNRAGSPQAAAYCQKAGHCRRGSTAKKPDRTPEGRIFGCRNNSR